MTTKAQALDHLTDVLAGEDVAGEPTVAGAIDKLAMMIEDGDITIDGELPIASADTLGGVKVGEGLAITDAGVLSASGDGGGATIVDVNFTGDSTYTSSMTANEIFELLEDGEDVILKACDNRGVPEQYQSTEIPYYCRVNKRGISQQSDDAYYEFYAISAWISGTTQIVALWSITVFRGSMTMANPIYLSVS